MKFETVVLNIENQIATITLNRPEHLNAGNRQMIDDLLTAFDLCDEDDEVKAIVVTGEGRAFCAGADISGGSSGFLDSEASESANTSSLPPRDIGGLITLRIYDLKKPIIAAINGAAAGMGVTMTLPMDFRLASNTAKLGFVFAKRGIVPESNSSYFLQKTVGITQALDWCMTGRIVSAQEALESGLVNQLCTPESLLLAAYELAKQIIENTAPVSIALTRQLLWKGLGLNHPMDAHLLKSHGVSTRGKSADAEEGTQSFLEKRPARFPMTVSEDMPAFYPWWQKREYK